MSKNANDIVIVAAARTPMGAFQGDLAALTGPQLGAAAIRAAVARANLAPEQVDEVLMGNVLQAGEGQAPARQAALGAGLPKSVGCTTVHKVCGSGMKAQMLAFDALKAESYDVVVAGGMESMSNAPYLLPKARSGMRLGHGQVLDHMFYDGLEDAYDKGRLMGTFAEDTAQHYGFTREQQDAYAIESTQRAIRAIQSGAFEWEIEPVTITDRGGERVVKIDEQPLKAKLDKIPLLKPAFRKDGTVTAANASSISDGAAALVLMRRETAEQLGCTPLARIVAHATHAHEPAWFTTAPVGAIEKVLAKAGWTADAVDLFEINEAFAVVTMAAMKELNLPHEKVNIHGGACALGHPIGASGARIVVTLIGALRHTGGKRGVASLCIGGGEATAMAIELE
ncbi:MULTISPECIES: acetyl-CoA C-acetyltransferase [Hydrogenophilus]|uniref:Acetyl-CoA acetyltransferase n=1 Tax=Hydrogenophilus thermoluteolus TaxID=297 RepID=A0A2Z6DVS8_HYDTE|nr:MULTISPECIES: acetyl-CoA C-acetyltransferase [Hydrogenophilus]MBW7656631.1 acetyl-CoA C-acetyltransferase [Hydrogenophilus thermoluteolus]BBD76537.1 acetyl-CoA acetyltransferase [Hydrogenophilus thermoluteolus]GLW60672.1 acetyl-CoA acetyltransferase [Hydrogenophilus thermoluteolus]